jgi:hypothetical protein
LDKKWRVDMVIKFVVLIGCVNVLIYSTILGLVTLLLNKINKNVTSV